jgi:hypothetical protein
MKSPIYYHYLRKPWRKWSWRTRRLEYVLRHNPELYVAYTEWKLCPAPTLGQHFSNSIVQLIFEAAVSEGWIIDTKGVRPPAISFLKCPVRRPGWQFHAPLGTKLRRKPEVQFA